jgi:carboxyl-terminal processing protease
MTKIRLPKISLKTVRKGFLISLLVGIFFGLGYWFGTGGLSDNSSPIVISRELPASKEALNFSLFWRVWDKLEESYFDKTKLVPSEMVYGAVSGMVSALGDPYTVFLSPKQNKVVQEDLSGNFEGVGIQIGFRGTQLAVIAPLPDTPASKAGIKAGDYIVWIKDKLKDVDRGTVAITLPEAVQVIRGRAGSVVTLTLLRTGLDEPFEVDIQRERIDVPSVILDTESPKIAHIKILKFDGETLAEWDNVVEEILRDKEIKAIVLDLRNNPGGYLDGAIDLASEFLENGKLVVTQQGPDGQRQELKVRRLGRLTNTKMVVLINKGSASAAEILAGALRDNKSIKLVGEVSFGKGTIQEPVPLDDGSALHVTTAKWLTPRGIWVNEGGLVPDVKIEDDPETEVDEQLEEAIRLLNVR